MKKKVLYLLCMAFAMMAWLPPQLWAQTRPSGGDGSSESPFLITTAEELKWYASYVNGESGDNVVHNTACAQLVEDIDLSTVCGKGKGSWTPIAKYDIYKAGKEKFDGVFDGNGHTISNLYINNTYGSYLGLFGYIQPTASSTSASVKNLKMDNVQIVGDQNIAAVCGFGKNVTFENIEVISGSITGSYFIYGICSGGGSARNCINRANVTGSGTYVAGIINTINDKVSNCSNYGKITTGKGPAGGIACLNKESNKLTDCANYGDIHVTGTLGSSGSAVGGLLGYPSNLEISNCANFGNIYLTEQSEFVGVIVGTHQLKKASGILTNTGNVYVNNVAQADVPVLQSGITWLYDKVDNTAKCLTPSAEQLTSGWLAWQLQQNCSTQTWGQNVSAEPKDAYPVIGGSVLYAVGSCINIQFSNDPGVVTHNLTHHDAVPATCSQTGNHEYWYCSDCKKHFKEAICENAYTDDADAETGVWIEIPHTLPADFDKNGLKYCSVCGHVEAEAPTLVADEASFFNGYYALRKAGHLVWLHNQVQVYDAETKTYPYESIKCYLANDISLKAVCHPADDANDVAEANWNPIGDNNPFKGIFDGNGQTVSDLYINKSGCDLGLFGSVDGAKIMNVIVQGDVTAARTDNDEYTGNYVGLVLGRSGSSDTELINCESRGSVTGYKYVGGIAGYVSSNGSVITSCTNRATVTSLGQNSESVGGIVGYGQGISLCANFADITAEGINVGGLAGQLNSNTERQGMSNCMNVGYVKGRERVGGLAGYCCAANNANNYSIGRVEATSQYAGLLVGRYANYLDKAFAKTYYVKEGLVVENGTITAGQYYGDCSGTITASAQAVRQADVASGKLANMLASVKSIWGQDLEQENTYPVLNGKAVYFSGRILCNGHLLSEAYTNDKTKEATTPAHSQEYEDGGF